MTPPMAPSEEMSRSASACVVDWVAVYERTEKAMLRLLSNAAIPEPSSVTFLCEKAVARFTFGSAITI